MSSAYVPAACDVCGGPLRRDNTYGVCARNPACLSERSRRTKYPDARDNYVRRESRFCCVCGSKLRLDNQDGVCRKTPGCRREKERRRVRKPEDRARWMKKYLARADRPCRYARSGCTAFALVNCHVCRTHQIDDGQRHWRVLISRQRDFLGERQHWMCPWCDMPIEPGTKTDIDHIIPKASGLVIEEDWNLQLLHSPCNRSKSWTITDRALALALEHEIELASDGNQPVGDT